MGGDVFFRVIFVCEECEVFRGSYEESYSFFCGLFFFVGF